MVFSELAGKSTFAADYTYNIYMRGYRLISGDGSIEELGDLDREQIMSLLAEAEKTLHNGAKEFGVGLYRSEADFIEITPVGNSEYLIFSDIIARKQGWKEYFFSKNSRGHLKQIIKGYNSAVIVIDDYMKYSRKDFEDKYSE